MNSSKLYDFIGIGIGPFNLGLAALAHPIKKLNGLFFDQRESFEWHPGMMIEDTTLQVPFMADLVTMVDPTSHFSFLNYLRENSRIYQFYIRENFYILRKEYNKYCQWAIGQLPSLKFSHQVKSIEYVDELEAYRLIVRNIKAATEDEYFTKKLVLGTGTSPYMPDSVKSLNSNTCFHTSEYLNCKKKAVKQKSITVVGSGQSAAEVFYDLLQEQDQHSYQLNWFTRADRYFPMEYSKLTLELTSPEYVDHFYHLPNNKREAILKAQNQLYKGINYDLINEIYDYLYQKSVDNEQLPVTLQPCAELIKVEENLASPYKLNLTFHHTQEEQAFNHATDMLILATGYKYKMPAFLEPIHHRIGWDAKGRFAVHRNHAIDLHGNEIFVQNAELHTHGFVTPDLGMGAQRNATVINCLLGETYFKLDQRIAFQQFGINKFSSSNKIHQTEEELVYS